MKESLLFTPCKIGPLTLRNRTIRAAAFEGMCAGNSPTDLLYDYHRSVARGGIGMTTLAYASVTRNGLSFPHQLWLRPEIVPGLRRITDAIHAEGAAAGIQIGHCGNLISQFLSPYTNRRRDEYGGSLENRMRFMKICMQEAMEAAGSDMAVLVKTNMRDGFRGGLEIDDCIEVARNLEACGAHALVLSGGFVSRAPMYVMRGQMPIRTLTYYMKQLWLKAGVKMAGRWMIPSVPFREAYFYEDALQFRKALKLPLVYVGGLVSREKIDMVLDSGFECVAMARALINEPDFVNRMKERGELRCGCEHTNYCIARMYSVEMACHRHLQGLPKCLQHEIERITARR